MARTKQLKSGDPKHEQYSLSHDFRTRGRPLGKLDEEACETGASVPCGQRNGPLGTLLEGFLGIALASEEALARWHMERFSSWDQVLEWSMTQIWASGRHLYPISRLTGLGWFEVGSVVVGDIPSFESTACPVVGEGFRPRHRIRFAMEDMTAQLGHPDTT